MIRFAPLFAALVLAGCATEPLPASHPMPVTPAAYAHAAAASSAVDIPATWWRLFDDPVLDALEDRAAAHSPTLQAAAAQLARARALARTTDATRWPQVGVSASSGRQGGDFFRAQGEAGTLHELRLDASWELDVFGRLAQASRAARLDAAASESLLADARLLVEADVAQAYFSLRALDAERALMRETVAAYRETLGLTDKRFAAGDVGELDVAQSRTEVASVESQALALDRRREALESALAVLVGELPGAAIVADGRWAERLPEVPAGLPSAMLARRPDLAAARSALEASQARLGVARDAWFPDLALTASAGGASPQLSDLFKASAGLWAADALLSLPLLDGGRREAGVQAAAATADEASARYRGQVLLAFKDVEDQLASLTLLKAQAGAQAQAVGASERALQLSDARYRHGVVSQLELLDARRTTLANRRLAVQVRGAQFEATVGLVKALGGGWSS